MKKGIPIGNLTSQIFANIYLNELDRFVKHFIKPRAYLRYGDDFIFISEDFIKLKYMRQETIKFIEQNLLLQINGKNDIIVKAKWGLKFLGVEIFTKGRHLNKRNFQKINSRMSLENISDYVGLLKQHSNCKKIKFFNWAMLDKFFNDENF